jgi:hypothetical protein
VLLCLGACVRACLSLCVCFLVAVFLSKDLFVFVLFASEEEAASLRFAEDKEEKRWLAVLFPLKAITRSRADD